MCDKRKWADFEEINSKERGPVWVILPRRQLACVQGRKDKIFAKAETERDGNCDVMLLAAMCWGSLAGSVVPSYPSAPHRRDPTG